MIRPAGPRPASSESGESVRLRYGRLCAAGSASAITLVSLLGGVGVLPADRTGAESARTQRPADGAGPSAAMVEAVVPVLPDVLPIAAAGSLGSLAPTTPPLPQGSGEGKRVVFDMSDQRVWLVGRGEAGSDDVRRSYLVSGSLTENLQPGTYAVYSRSRWAVGIGDSGVMEYFVRFTRGNNAAIGFHSIPTKDGRALQTRAQLGTPQSHGCIRQALPDARRLWAFAPEGTTVVVTA